MTDQREQDQDKKEASPGANSPGNVGDKPPKTPSADQDNEKSQHSEAQPTDPDTLKPLQKTAETEKQAEQDKQARDSQKSTGGEDRPPKPDDTTAAPPPPNESHGQHGTSDQTPATFTGSQAPAVDGTANTEAQVTCPAGSAAQSTPAGAINPGAPLPASTGTMRANATTYQTSTAGAPPAQQGQVLFPSAPAFTLPSNLQPTVNWNAPTGMQAPSGWPFVVPTYVYPPPRIQPQLQQQQQQQPYQVIQPQQYQQSQQQQQLTMCNQPPPLSTYWYYHPTGAPYPIPASVPATTTHVSPWFGNTAHYLTNPPPQYYAMPPCYVPQPTYCQGSTPYYYYYYPPYQYHPCDTSRPGPY